MELIDTTLREHGLPGRLGPALADYLDALDRPAGMARRRAWTRLVEAHAAHQAVLGGLTTADLAAAGGEAREALRGPDRDRPAAPTPRFARAEAPSRRPLRTRPPRGERSRRARRYAVASMYLDAALQDALGEA